jgi:septal ring factor EnvC (AmiA/AmiB activator)
VAALLALGGAVRADDARKLEEIRTQIEEREARAREYAEEAEGALGELEGIDRRLHEVRRSLGVLRQRERAAEEELKGVHGRLEEAERSRQSVQNLLEKRLVALYKFHATGGIPTFYGASTFQELVLRRVALARVVEQDERLFGEYRAVEARLDAARLEAERLVSEIQQARRGVVDREERARRRLVERRNLVALLRTRADRERRLAQELREAGERLERVLADRPSQVEVAGEPLVAGRIPRPVDGPVRLGFGRQVHPEFGTETIRNGVEIEAPRGTPVRAVAAGRVLFAGWFKGYGQIVILDHGEADVSVSGYLEEVAVESGTPVARGDVIGRVGETGSLSGPGLYFEIRHRGKPVDPEGWFGRFGREGSQ